MGIKTNIYEHIHKTGFPSDHDKEFGERGFDPLKVIRSTSRRQFDTQTLCMVASSTPSP